MHKNPPPHHRTVPAQHGVEGVRKVEGIVAGRGTVVSLMAERGAVGVQGPELWRQVPHRLEREVGAHGQREPGQGVHHSLSNFP